MSNTKKKKSQQELVQTVKQLISQRDSVTEESAKQLLEAIAGIDAEPKEIIYAIATVVIEQDDELAQYMRLSRSFRKNKIKHSEG
jgi:hypothetical protein